MKFFMPACTTDDKAESTYNAIKLLVKETVGWDITDRRIFRIEFQHKSIPYEAEVGKVTDFNREMVVAILESHTFLICTTSRGALSGAMPIVVSKENTRSTEDFEEIEAKQ